MNHKMNLVSWVVIFRLLILTSAEGEDVAREAHHAHPGVQKTGSNSESYQPELVAHYYDPTTEVRTGSNPGAQLYQPELVVREHYYVPATVNTGIEKTGSGGAESNQPEPVAAEHHYEHATEHRRKPHLNIAQIYPNRPYLQPHHARPDPANHPLYLESSHEPTEVLTKNIPVMSPIIHRQPYPMNHYVHFNRPVIPPEMITYHQPYVAHEHLPFLLGAHNLFHAPRQLYHLEDVYKMLPFYENHPELENYAPPRYTAYRQKPTRKTTTTPPIEYVPEIENYKSPTNGTQGEETHDSHGERTEDSVHKAPLVYAVISDKVSNPGTNVERIVINDETNKEGEVPRVILPRKQVRPQIHNIPVPFVKVIRFYPLHPDDMDESHDEVNRPRYYSAPIRDRYVPKPKDIQGDGSANKGRSVEGPVYRYEPVYYYISTLPTPKNKMDTKSSA